MFTTLVAVLAAAPAAEPANQSCINKPASAARSVAPPSGR